MDTDEIGFYQFQNHLKKKRSNLTKIEQFLERELLSYVDYGQFQYSTHLLELIDQYVKKPQEFFDLVVLNKNQITRLPYEKINLPEAIHNGIYVDIDWCLANKMLGLLAIQN